MSDTCTACRIPHDASGKRATSGDGGHINRAQMSQPRRLGLIAIQPDEVYQRYTKYPTGCADLFRNGYTAVCQFTLEKY
jgi:Mycolic acid cyclopropane synthetase